MILYHYYHCPFCVRVRLALGFLKMDYEAKAFSYDDEEGPVKLSGKKMLPIVDFGDGKIMNESLDIIRELDQEDRLSCASYFGSTEEVELEERLSELAKPIHNLAMPHWIYTKEFSPEARKYFQQKKELKRGPFANLIKNKEDFLQQLSPLLEDLEKQLQDEGFYRSDSLRIQDILLASHLWGMYIVPEFQFSARLHAYLQSIKEASNFHYMDDLWT